MRRAYQFDDDLVSVRSIGIASSLGKRCLEEVDESSIGKIDGPRALDAIHLDKEWGEDVLVRLTKVDRQVSDADFLLSLDNLRRNELRD